MDHHALDHAAIALVCLLATATTACEGAGEEPLTSDADVGVADTEPPSGNSWIYGEPGDERPTLEGMVSIDGVGELVFDPLDIQRTRPELFQEGHFSIYDVLAHLAERGELELVSRFDSELDTHVVESIDGLENYWYYVWYHGGWRERSVHRMDYYPVKDLMTIRFETEPVEDLELREQIWRTEVARRQASDGAIVVPEVTIRFRDRSSLTFNDVDVTAHDLRADMLQPGTITALDVIMSLGDREELTYGLIWTRSIGQTVARNYYVEDINGQRHFGYCGFVYEVGEQESWGNHIHVTPDMRILQSPGYVLFYWIELGPCGL